MIEQEEEKNRREENGFSFARGNRNSEANLFGGFIGSDVHDVAEEQLGRSVFLPS